MTYWAYHLIFTLPLLLILLWLVRDRLRLGHVASFLVVGAIVMAFTIPWDNYAAYLGVWGFGEGVSLCYPFASLSETTPILGHIPIEEYSYFMIQTALVVLFTIYLLPHPKRL